MGRHQDGLSSAAKDKMVRLARKRAVLRFEDIDQELGTRIHDPFSRGVGSA
ncbi:hypothetical protein ARUE_c13070 [Arthrobacter sp. Rue61a]|nr:hypothetical protein ARUE_c13070 [Arthrobacter sp. Rue61a]